MQNKSKVITFSSVQFSSVAQLCPTLCDPMYRSMPGLNLRVPLGLALGSPIFPTSCEGKLGDALESLQGRRTSPRRVSGT